MLSKCSTRCWHCCFMRCTECCNLASWQGPGCKWPVIVHTCAAPIAECLNKAQTCLQLLHIKCHGALHRTIQYVMLKYTAMHHTALRYMLHQVIAICYITLQYLHSIALWRLGWGRQLPFEELRRKHVVTLPSHPSSQGVLHLQLLYRELPGI